ncbi:TrkA C-terminal domain-containing protein [Crateriforma conspicua]|uniref:TrkA-C domain protein n=1 Tax=Crateriforma conspicua TaxID=2527996 RepID=A0A5C5XRH5_9PLAN|nr:TrkA C-terminal domain-containing protein [Crateriforma conspicua]QDV66109.1 TrkA-C domain protein [Crateriforma conspicua]TWT65494.1 TrkA-C domain protein [Crateriforma conspicua]
MAAIITLLLTLSVSLLITRVAAMALMLTGLSREAARFQARSAFSGVGFTTTEAESIVNHPVRRRIAMMLMLFGNIGLATVGASLMVSMLDAKNNETWWTTLIVLFVGVTFLLLLARSRWVERRLNRIIAWSLRRFTDLDVRDYVAVLNLQEGFAVTEMRVDPGDWLSDKTLIELDLPREGVLILGVHSVQADQYIGAPVATTKICVGDTLVMYGPIERLKELDQRRTGNRGYQAHRSAVRDYQEILADQQQKLAR